MSRLDWFTPLFLCGDLSHKHTPATADHHSNESTNLELGKTTTTTMEILQLRCTCKAILLSLLLLILPITAALGTEDTLAKEVAAKPTACVSLLVYKDEQCNGAPVRSLTFPTFIEPGPCCKSINLDLCRIFMGTSLSITYIRRRFWPFWLFFSTAWCNAKTTTQLWQDILLRVSTVT